MILFCIAKLSYMKLALYFEFAIAVCLLLKSAANPGVQDLFTASDPNFEKCLLIMQVVSRDTTRGFCNVRHSAVTCVARSPGVCIGTIRDTEKFDVALAASKTPRRKSSLPSVRPEPQQSKTNKMVRKERLPKFRESAEVEAFNPHITEGTASHLLL